LDEQIQTSKDEQADLQKELQELQAQLRETSQGYTNEQLAIEIENQENENEALQKDLEGFKAGSI